MTSAGSKQNSSEQNSSEHDSSEAWRNLQQAYSQLGDDELLRLAGQRDGLTELAQGVLDAEMHTRGLALAAPKVAVVEELPGGQVSIFSGLAAEAWVAAAALEEAEIHFEVRGRGSDADAESKTNLSTMVDIIVAAEDAGAAGVVLLRTSRQFAPVVLTAQERADYADYANADGEPEPLFPLADFESDDDLRKARAALASNGIFFSETKGDRALVVGDAIAVTSLEVRFDDLDRAGAVLDAAYPEPNP